MVHKWNRGRARGYFRQCPQQSATGPYNRPNRGRPSVQPPRFRDGYRPHDQPKQSSNHVDYRRDDHRQSDVQPAIASGTKGKTDVGCNFIKIQTLDEQRAIYEYEVLFTPDVDDKGQRSFFVRKHSNAVGLSKKVYDLGSRLWSPIDIGNEEVTSGEYEFHGNKVRVAMRRKGQKTMAECQMVLNVVMKRIMTALDFVRFRNSDFNPRTRVTIPQHKLEIWSGITPTIAEYDGGVFLNIDASFRVLRCGTVHDLLSEILTTGVTGSTFKEKALSSILGMSVITRYNNRIVRIDDIDFGANPLSTFVRKGEKISYMDYFKYQYNITIKDIHQPMLVSRVKRKPIGKEDEEILNYYVPELCCPTGLTEEQRNNFRLMLDIAKETRLTPQKRHEELIKFLRDINSNEKCKQFLNDWGLKIPERCIELEAKILSPEKIQFGNRTIEEPNADWGRALSSAAALRTVDVHDWAVIYTSRDERIMNMFTSKAMETTRKIGMCLMAPKYKIRVDDRNENYCSQLKNLHQDVQIVVIIVPTRREDRYVCIKQLCNKLALPSQVINSRTLQNPQRVESVVMKVVHQMNCKLGGAPWSVSIPHAEDGVMFCGIDISHETGRARPGASVIALVCSIDQNVTSWTSKTAMISPGQTILDCLQQLFEPCLNEWFKSNGTYPKRILVYRSGVGDGQLDTVKNFEIPQLRRVFNEVQDYTPELTFIVVQRRIPTRYYTKKFNGTHENPRPGTICDHTITKIHLHDFYLVSPKANQGTVSPTHYIIVEDSTNMHLDFIETITFKLCQLYYNWSASIAVPAPVQYAQKLAAQVRLRILAPTSGKIVNSLFFL